MAARFLSIHGVSGQTLTIAIKNVATQTGITATRRLEIFRPELTRRSKGPNTRYAHAG